MSTYFLFLRAINVGGHNMIKMTQLALWMQQLGFLGIKTHLNSGNVVFQSGSNDSAEISSKIREKILLEAKLEIACIVRNFSELSQINTILLKHETSKAESSTLYVTLLSDLPLAENIEKLKVMNPGSDSFTLYDKEIILECNQPYHKTKLSNNFFEKVLKVEATSRNRNTIEAMLRLRKTE